MTAGDRPVRIGLLAPMPSELQPVVKVMGLQRTDAGDRRVYEGKVGNVGVIATNTGMGTRLATEATERLLDSTEVDHVMVVGIAGGLGTSAVGDVLYPEVVVDKVSRSEYRPSHLGDIKPHGRLVTHDDFDMQPDEHRQLVAEGFIAVDMETAAVAAVCERRGCRWSVVRVISDLVGVTPGDVIGLAHPDGSPNTRAALRYMLTKPWRIPRLVRLGRDSYKAANTAARAASGVLQKV